MPFPSYRGLWVECVLQAVDLATGRPTGPALSKVALGDMLAVTIQVGSLCTRGT